MKRPPSPQLFNGRAEPQRPERTANTPVIARQRPSGGVSNRDAAPRAHRNVARRRSVLSMRVLRAQGRFELLTVLWLIGGAVACRTTASPAADVVSDTSGGAQDAASDGQRAPSVAVRYVSLGDSFTAGTGATPEQSFAARLAARWSASGVAVELENPAVNGYTTGDVIARELDVLARVRPTFVTLAIGANNIVRGGTDEAYRADLQRILQAIVASGARPAAIVAIPQPEWPRSPTGQSFGDPAATLNRVRVFNAILREEVQRVGGQWQDLGPLMTTQADRAMWAPDGLHPSAEAYDQWAEALARAYAQPPRS